MRIPKGAVYRRNPPNANAYWFTQQLLTGSINSQLIMLQNSLHRVSKKTLSTAAAIGFALGIPVAQAFTEKCDFFLRADRASPELRDRQPYYQVPGSGEWEQMRSSGLYFIGKRINFAYVIVENFSRPHPEAAFARPRAVQDHRSSRTTFRPYW